MPPRRRESAVERAARIFRDELAAHRRELIAELRRSTPPDRERGVDAMRRAYENADDPAEVRRRRRRGTGGSTR